MAFISENIESEGYITGDTLTANTITAGIVSATTVSVLNLINSGTLKINGILTPTQITEHVNNYNPTGLSSANVLRLSSDGPKQISGIIAQESGVEIRIINVGLSNITIVNSSALSDVENRFDIGLNLIINLSTSCTIWYDITSARWRIISHY